MNIDIGALEKDYLNLDVTWAGLEQKYGVCEKTVRRIARKNNWPRIDRSINKYRFISKLRPKNDVEIDDFVSEYSRLSREEICNKYGAKWSTVRQWATVFNAKRDRKVNASRLQELNVICKNENPYRKTNYDDLIELFKKYHEVSRSLFPQKIIDVEIKTDRPIALVFTSDWHLGHPGVDIESFDRDIKALAAADNVCIYLGGDTIENMIAKPEAVAHQIDVNLQYELLLKILTMLQDKIIAFGCGNHDLWTESAAKFDPMQSIARRMKLLYTRDGGLLNLKVGNIEYKIFRQHQYRSNCLTGDTKIKLVDGTIATIEELCHKIEPYYVYGLNSKHGGLISLVKATPAKITGENVPVFEIVLDNGKSFKATADHLVMIKNGRHLSYYKKVSELHAGDSLMPFNYRWGDGRGYGEIVKIVSIKAAGIADKVYDIETETHNFAIEAGVFVHNSSANLTHSVKQMLKNEDYDFHIGCLLPQSKIRTFGNDEKYKNICDVKIGDKLVGYDETSKKLALTTVVKTFSGQVERYFQIKLENGHTIYATEEHPFMVNEQWIKASDLKINDELYCFKWNEIAYIPEIAKQIGQKAAKTRLERVSCHVNKIDLMKELILNSRAQLYNGKKIVSITKFFPKHKAKVYNLQCEPHNNYFVDIILSHNCIEHGHVPVSEEFYWKGQKRVAFKTGSYKILWDEYAEKKGFTGTKALNPTVILFPNKFEILSFLDMYSAMKVLDSIRKD